MIPSLWFIAAASGPFIAVAVRKRKPRYPHLSQSHRNWRRPRCLAGVIRALLDDRRGELRRSLESSSFDRDREADKESRRQQLNLGVAVGGLLLASGGVLIAPILLLPSILCILYVSRVFFQDVHRIWREERRLDYRIIWAATVLLALSAGFVWTAAFALLLRTLNGYLVALTEVRSKQELSHLFSANMRSAWRLVDGAELETPIDAIKAGDLVVVQAGQTVPVDGIIEGGAALLDQHMLTGEAEPAERTVGDRVLAVTLLLAGRIVVRVQRTGNDTLSSDIVKVLGQTSDFKRTLQSRTDRWLNLMAVPVMGLGLMALPAAGASGAIAVLWYYPGGRMLVYGPLSMLSYLQLAARRGILVKDGRALEVLQQVDAFVFDKTGTLTEEQPQVASVEAREGHDAHTVLAYAAAAEARHEHPIARAIRDAALEWGCAHSIQAAPAVKVGFGIKAEVGGVTVRVGSAKYLASEDVSTELDLEALQRAIRDKGHSLVLVAFDDRIVGMIELEPRLRPDTANVIRGLRERGMHTVMISGDEAGATARLAEALGIDRYYAEILPQEKAQLVKNLQAEGRKVCFVGDGINDAIALKCADVAISLRGATTLATDTAQIVLMDGDLQAVPELMRLADAFAANMRLNLAASLLPATVGVLGTFAFGWGLPLCILLVQASTPVGLYNAVRPIIGERQRSTPVAKEKLAAGQEKQWRRPRFSKGRKSNQPDNASSLGRQ